MISSKLPANSCNFINVLTSLVTSATLDGAGNLGSLGISDSTDELT
jgi:hypothetical protein